MKTKLLLLLFLANFALYAQQYTLIPDRVFEQALIQLGHDDILDGKVTTATISTVTHLNVSNREITDLTGIEAFTSLFTLNTSDNELTFIDLSKNTALAYLDIKNNKLEKVNVSGAVGLQRLNIEYNKLSSIDLSKNTALQYLYINKNQLETLDVSGSANLYYLNASNNNLKSLNLKNVNFNTPNPNKIKSNNLKIGALPDDYYVRFNFINNVNLNCIQVDDVAVANASSTIIRKDATAEFSLACSTYTLIPDPNFEQALFAQGYDDIIDGKVTTASIRNVTSLDVSNKGIKNLTGIESFTSLNTLYANNNELTTLDLSSNTLVYHLNVSGNQLSSINVSNNSALSLLDIYNNKLETLDISKNTKLEILRAKNNTLKELNVSGSAALYILDVSNNNLTSLNLKNIKFGSVIYSKNSNLKNAKIGANPDLNFSNNLDLKCIQVDDVATAKASTRILKDVNAEFNLDCTEYTLIPDPNFEQALIDIGYDNIIDGKVATETISKITNLYIANRGIKDLTGIEGFTSLYLLYAEDNELTTLDLSSNTLLTSLVVYNNKLESINVSGANALEQLSLAENQLSSIDVSNNTDLRYLIINNNKLETLDVSDNTKLQSLRVNNNILKELNVSGSADLIFLDASNNNLTSLNLKNINFNPLIANKIKLNNAKNGAVADFNFTNNTNLTCIEVDDVAVANASTRILKDATAEFSLDCTEYTLIPDPNFEQALIDLGHDDSIDGKVATEKISSIQDIDLSAKDIESLTGIEDFSELSLLIVSENKLKTLDITKNKKLGALLCDNNQLTNFTFSEENTALYGFNCSNNELTSIDVSKNPAIYVVICTGNKLSYLNLQNRSVGLNTEVSKFTGNANLKCILVDDAEYANTSWETLKDETATYTTNCQTLGTPTILLNKAIVYPNPTRGDLHIDNVVLEKATVYDVLGKLVKTTTFADNSNNNTINLDGLPRGIYYIYLESEGSTIVKKIIVE